jgi:hypothetical protein
MGSVRFICGTQTLHKQLEATISEFYETEDTILYSSCWSANEAIFATLLGGYDAIVSDELNHASIIDGIRLCKAEKYVYRHNDLGDLGGKLAQARQEGARFVLVVSDGVFSMEGATRCPGSAICTATTRAGGGRLPRHRRLPLGRGTARIGVWQARSTPVPSRDGPPGRLCQWPRCPRPAPALPALLTELVARPRWGGARFRLVMDDPPRSTERAVFPRTHRRRLPHPTRYPPIVAVIVGDTPALAMGKSLLSGATCRAWLPVAPGQRLRPIPAPTPDTSTAHRLSVVKEKAKG